MLFQKLGSSPTGEHTQIVFIGRRIVDFDALRRAVEESLERRDFVRGLYPGTHAAGLGQGGSVAAADGGFFLFLLFPLCFFCLSALLSFGMLDSEAAEIR